MKPGRVARSDTQLLAASIVASLAGAAFVIAVERHLGADDFEPVAQLWNMWAISAAFLTLALQLGTIGTGADLAQVVNRTLVVAVLGLAAAFGALATLYDDELFDSRSGLWPALAICVPIGAAAMGVTRGYWAGRRRFDRTAIVIGSENVIRLVLAVVLIVAGGGTGWFGAAIVLGFAPVLATPWSEFADEVESRPPVSSNAVAAGAATATLLSFATFSSAPVLIAVNGGSDTAATAAFLALALTRIPHGLIQGIIPRLSVAANAVVESGDAERTIHWQRQAGVAVILGGPVVAGAAAFVLGPLAELLFGAAARLSRASYGLAMLAAVMNLGLVVQIILLAAQRRVRLLAAGWLVAIPAIVIAAAASDLDTPRSVFLAASVIELAVLVAYLLWPAPVTERSTPAPR